MIEGILSIRQWDMPAPLARELLEMARQCAPQECCGFLFAADPSDADNGKTIHGVHWVRNNDRRPGYFRMDPHGMQAVLAHMEEEFQELIGLVHSHPQAQPVPTQRDIDTASWMMMYPYFIIDHQQGDIKAWDISTAEAHELEVAFV